jgi:hypothetical protein
MQRYGGMVLDWEVIAIIVLGGAAVAGIGYLLYEYRVLRDFDWS